MAVELFFICLLIFLGVSDLFRFFSRVLGGIKLSKNMYDLSTTLVFLQQLRQLHKHNIFGGKIQQSTLQKFLPSRFRRNLLTANLEVLERIELN